VGYNAQHAVDEAHQLIVHHELTQACNDTQQLQPMAHATCDALEDKPDLLVTDAGYSNGRQISDLQSSGYEVAVPSNRAINTQGDGNHFQKRDFAYLPEEDAYRCPAGKLLTHKTVNNCKRLHLYARTGCSQCPLQHRCTLADQRWITRHFDEAALEKATKAATPERMIRRMATVEPTFGTLKRMLNKGRLTCWGLSSASSEYALAVLSYNLMRSINVLGVKGMLARLA
jgi:transposase